MSLKDKINEDLKAAMKSGEKVRLEAIRSIRTALLNKEVSIRVGGVGTLSPEQEMEVLVSLGKQRRDSIEQYKAGNRPDLAEKEAAELAVIEEYLPKQLSEAEVKEVIDRIVAQVGAASAKDMGKVMGPAMKELKGKADGGLVQQLVKERLGA
ncbi:MAG: GatB/YqeY domain-containing protein [Chlorobiales bacterium]|nr:GatB/YqeY domain-containing protein [Chlorobiales bacterium]